MEGIDSMKRGGNPIGCLALKRQLNTDAVRPIDVVMVSLGGNDVAFKIRHGDSLKCC